MKRPESPSDLLSHTLMVLSSDPDTKMLDDSAAHMWVSIELHIRNVGYTHYLQSKLR